MLWSGTCSLNGVLPTGKTPQDIRSESCFPSCKRGWSEGCLPPSWKCVLPQLLRITMQLMVSLLVGMTWSSSSLEWRGGWTLLVLPRIPLGPVSGAHGTAKTSLWTFAVSWVEKDSSPNCIGFHQEVRGPAGIFGQWIVPRIWADQLSHCPKTQAWICAQGSYHSLQGQGSEPASTALGGGRPSPSFSLSGPCSVAVRGQNSKLQDLRPALCLLRRPAEGKGCVGYQNESDKI